MGLDRPDRDIIVAELGREPTRTESVLFENLWSEHCAYRSSRSLLGLFESDGDHVLIGPGDDAAVVQVSDDIGIAIGIESHNHPSFVDPYDGAATGVGGIVRDIISMGAYPIALVDCLYFGPFSAEHSQYLFEGVVEGIADYGNAIGVPTVGGGVTFHDGYRGNPLVNVGCIGVVPTDRLVTATAQTPGNHLVLIGNATGRDGLGGASFASEDVGENAATEDRPAVQVGDPYTEKLLIEVNEALLAEGVVESARDLGAAGLGGATCEMMAKGGLGATIYLDDVHQREPNMRPPEILLAESQERMCYEVNPENTERVRAIADRFDLGHSVIGEVTDSNYVCYFNDEIVVDVPPQFVADGAPMNELSSATPPEPDRDLPHVALEEAFESVVGSPNTAKKDWVYRQYDHEVGVRTRIPPGSDAAVIALREAGVGIALSAGANPYWTSVDPVAGAGAIVLENAMNLAVTGATPVAAVDCLNGGNPETPRVYGGFAGIVRGLAEMASEMRIPVVGGNVSLYNDSVTGPIPPTPTLFLLGVTESDRRPSMTFTGDGSLLLVGSHRASLGGSEYLAQVGGSDRFPTIDHDPRSVVDITSDIATLESTRAIHDVSHGGLAVALSEMVCPSGGARVALPESGSVAEQLFSELPGRFVIETTDPEGIADAIGGVAPVREIGEATATGTLEITTDSRTLSYSASDLDTMRSTIADTLD